MNSCMNFHIITWLLVFPKPKACEDFIKIKDSLKIRLVKPIWYKIVIESSILSWVHRLIESN